MLRPSTTSVSSEIDEVARENTRYELKMVVASSASSSVRHQLQLHPAGIRQTYEPRLVNSVYFDDYEFSRYRESVEGISDRQKVRLRWYGDTFSPDESALEIKRKKGQLGWKLTHPINTAFNFEASVTWNEIISAMLDLLSPRRRIDLQNALNPVVINRYRREYFATADGEVRVTIDTGQVAFGQIMTPYPNVRCSVRLDSAIVIEIKAPRVAQKRLQEVANALPHKVTRHSKYALACQATLSL